MIDFLFQYLLLDHFGHFLAATVVVAVLAVARHRGRLRPAKEATDA